MNNNVMIGRKVRFKGFRFYEGWKWEYGGEGKIVAETKTSYKIKTSFLRSVWVSKEMIEEITS